MKGSQSKRLALSITSVFILAAGLFYSLSVVAAKFIWPDHSEIVAAFPEEALPLATETVVVADATPVQQPESPKQPSVVGVDPVEPLVAAPQPKVTSLVAQPTAPKVEVGAFTMTIFEAVPVTRADVVGLKTSDLGPSLRAENDMATSQPSVVPAIASNEPVDEIEIPATRVGGQIDVQAILAAFPLGSTDVSDTTYSEGAFDLATPVNAAPTQPKPVVDPELELDLRIAALAKIVGYSTEETSPNVAVEMFIPAVAADHYVLANAVDTPPTEELFSMGLPEATSSVTPDPDTPLMDWPQRVDHDAVLAVSQSIAPPKIVTTFEPAEPFQIHRRFGAPRSITAPELRVASLSKELKTLPPAITPVTDTRAQKQTEIQTLVIAPSLAKTGTNNAGPSPEENNVVVASLTTDRDIAEPGSSPIVTVGEAPDGATELPIASVAAPTASPRPQKRTRSPAITRDEAPATPNTRAKAVDPTPSPGTKAIQSVGSTNRIAVVGIFQTKAAAWVLLELSDGRIVKATKGTEMSNFKVSRIGSDKVWIRTGGTEKGLAMGQYLTVK